MKVAKISSRKIVNKNNYSSPILHEIDQTIAELEIYLENNDDDEMACLQYEQFLKKRKELLFHLNHVYSISSLNVMQA